MNKFIIENRTDLNDFYVIKLVLSVINQGRISNNGKDYCYGTAFTIEDEQYMVNANKNEQSEKFIITNRY